MKRHPKSMPVLSHGKRSRQQGVVMYVALVVLVVMTLAGLAMMRQMGSGVSIAGNLAFKENATSVADFGTESAINWLVLNAVASNNDVLVGTVYFSSWMGGVGLPAGTALGANPSGADWVATWNAAPLSAAIAGNTVQYVIHRLCQVPGLAPSNPGQRCTDSGNPNAGASKGGIHGGEASFTPAPQPYYRLTARVNGPRNTVSYTQVVFN